MNSFLHNDMSNDLTKPKQVQNEVFNFSENKMEIIVFSQILFHFFWTNNSVLSFHQVSLLHFLPTFLTMLNSSRNFEKGVERFSESRCKVWDCEMAPLEIYCYHRPLLHLFAWIRLSTTTPGCWKFSRQKRREEERRRKQAHIFSGTFEVCLIFCKIGSLKLSNVKRLSIRRQEICALLRYFFPFSTNDSFLIQKNWKEDSISDK